MIKVHTDHFAAFLLPNVNASAIRCESRGGTDVIRAATLVHRRRLGGRVDEDAAGATTVVSFSTRDSFLRSASVAASPRLLFFFSS